MTMDSDYWTEQYKERPDLTNSHLASLKFIANSTCDGYDQIRYLNAGWLTVAIFHNDEIVINKILNHLKVPSDGLTTKERISYYYLTI